MVTTQSGFHRATAQIGGYLESIWKKPRSRASSGVDMSPPERHVRAGKTQ